jgi:hypothetical protein
VAQGRQHGAPVVHGAHARQGEGAAELNEQHRIGEEAEVDGATAFNDSDGPLVLNSGPSGARRLKERKGWVRAAAIWREIT